MKDIDVVVFDLGGVLLDLNKDVCIKSFAKIGYYHADQFLNIYHQQGILKELEKGNVTNEEFRTFIREDIEGDVSDEAIDNALISLGTSVAEYKLRLLKELRKTKKVFLLSNTNEIMFKGFVKRYFENNGDSINDYFDRLFLSYQIHIMKPDRSIFLQMINESGIEPSRTLFLDDAADNVLAAQELGIKTHLVSPNENLNDYFIAHNFL